MKAISHYFATLSISHKLLLLFLLALLVRIIGINFGYMHGDERVNFSAKILTGQLVPDQHYYPPLLNYLTALCFAALYVIGRLFTAWYDLAGFRAQYFADPTVFFITARLLVAFISAAVAPLFYFVARELGCSRTQCWVAALFAVFTPSLILLSHLFKSDVPLAVMVVLVFYIALLKLKTPNSIKLDMGLGLAISLAMSFKHSYIFILFPFFLGYVIIYYLSVQNIQSLLKSMFFIGLACIGSWLIFNIGILLDFQNFMDYQKIQAVMSIREDKSFWPGLSRWWVIFSDAGQGLNVLVIALFLLSPIMLFLDNGFSKEQQRLLGVFWFSLVLGSLILIYLSGARQHNGLWISYMVSMQLFAVLFLLVLYRSRNQIIRWLFGALGLVTLCACIYGTFIVFKQGVSKPLVEQIEDILAQNYSRDTYIWTTFELLLPQTKDMQLKNEARSQRLADKYKIELPPRAPEAYQGGEATNALNYFDMPMVFDGLQHVSDEDLEGIVKPHGWPLQEEEWQLDYWLDQNFTVFILRNHHDLLLDDRSKLLQTFHGEVKGRCQLIKHLDPVKPLFIEMSATLYDCTQA